MLHHKGMNPAFQAECNADAMHCGSPLDLYVEGPAKEIRVIVERTYSETTAVRKESSNLVFGVGTQLEVALGDRIRGEEERIACRSYLACNVMLIEEAAWTDRGAHVVLQLAKYYGTSILRNALALAEAMDIEDGEAGL